MAIPQPVGYLSLFLIVLLGEAGLPLFAPAELLLVAAGVSAQNQDASLGLVIALALTADLLGTAALFALLRLTERPPAGSRLSAFRARLAIKAQGLGADRPWRVAIGRCLPMVRIPTCGAAALAGLPVSRFVPAALAGGAVWVLSFVGVGYVVAAQATSF